MATGGKDYRFYSGTAQFKHVGVEVRIILKHTPCKAQWSLYVQSVVTICTTRITYTKFHVLLSQCSYVFYVDLRTNSDYFPMQH
jgi:hypothetical protein